MRTVGPNEASPSGPSLKIVDASSGAGRAQSLKAGALVSVRILEFIGPDTSRSGADASRSDPVAWLYRVAIGSRLLVASSATALTLGSTLQARMENSSGATLVLKIMAPAPSAGAAENARLPRASAAAAIAAAGLPSDAAAFSALAALLREGISPEPRVLARVRRAALVDKSDATEIAARMEAKGIPAEGEALEGLIEALAGGRPGGGGLGNGGKGDGGSGTRGESGDEAEPEAHGEARGAPEPDREALVDASLAEAENPALSEATALGQELGRDFEREIPVSELGRTLAALLRGLALRVAGDIPSAGASSAGAIDAMPRGSRKGREGDTLALFNHLRGPEGSWVIVPFRFGLDSIDFAGSLRILLPYAQGGAGRLEAVFSASRRTGRDEWAAFLSFGGGRASSLRIVAPKGSAGTPGGAGMERFAAELAAFSCSVRFGVRADSGAEGGSRDAEGLDLEA